jgi:geranylgeranyl diphosphate synthase, type II
VKATLSSVSSGHCVETPPTSLSQSARLVLVDKAQQINAAINDYLNNIATESTLYTALHCALAGSGKRFRALLVMASGEAVYANKTLLFDSAIAIEMVHAHSLILDDLPCMDDAKMRRNQPALHIQFGESIAQLAASTLLSEAYSVLTKLHDVQATARCQILSRACGLNGIAQGQVEDLFGSAPINQMKTAPLIAGALQLGLCSGGHASAYQVDCFSQFGMHLGNAYQLRDDALDEKMLRTSLQKRAEQEADRALQVLSHAGLDTPLLRLLVQYSVQRGY